MRMPKDPASLDGMTTDFNSGEPYVMFAGTPMHMSCIQLVITISTKIKNNFLVK